MPIKFHEVVQGTPEWFAARCGLLTASEIDRVLTPTLKIAENANSKTHLYEMIAQRATNYVEDGFVSFAMERGKLEEELAKSEYSKSIAPVREIGFITNDRHGMTLGCSPDGLVGEEGQIEVKSRAQKYQMQTILQCAACDPPIVPTEFMLQIQTGLLITEREWCDFISICSGFNMVVIRVYPDPVYRAAILKAATEFEQKIIEGLARYQALLESGDMIRPIEHRVTTEMY